MLVVQLLDQQSRSSSTFWNIESLDLGKRDSLCTECAVYDRPIDLKVVSAGVQWNESERNVAKQCEKGGWSHRK